MIVWALVACEAGHIALGGADSAAAPDTGEAVERLPGDTAADTGEAAPDEAKPDAPVQVELTCPGPIPAESYIPCAVVMRWPDGAIEVEGTVQIHVRGRSSASFPKPQYKLEFVDDAWAPAAVELFGMGRESDWVLNGMWIDRALIRNRLAWDLANALATGEDWAPEAVYAEVTLDGDYQGLYLLNETIDRDASRLDFAEDDGSGERFIASADEEGALRSRLQYASWAIDYPNDAGGQSGAVGHLRAWEAAVSAGDPWSHMDLDSWVAFILVEELTKNNDGYFLSHRVWRGDDGMLRLVPWDLDLTLGQPNYNDNWLSSGWIVYRSDLVVLSADDTFRAAFAERWRAAREEELATDAVLARVAALRAEMGDAVDRNWARWDIASVDFYGYLTPITDPEVEYAGVNQWLEERLAWIDDHVDDY